MYPWLIEKKNTTENEGVLPAVHVDDFLGGHSSFKGTQLPKEQQFQVQCEVFTWALTAQINQSDRIVYVSFPVAWTQQRHVWVRTGHRPRRDTQWLHSCLTPGDVFPLCYSEPAHIEVLLKCNGKTNKNCYIHFYHCVFSVTYKYN